MNHPFVVQASQGVGDVHRTFHRIAPWQTIPFDQHVAERTVGHQLHCVVQKVFRQSRVEMLHDVRMMNPLSDANLADKAMEHRLAAGVRRAKHFDRHVGWHVGRFVGAIGFSLAVRLRIPLRTKHLPGAPFPEHTGEQIRANAITNKFGVRHLKKIRVR